MAKRWYVVHTYSGYENKVKEHLEQAQRGETAAAKKLGQILIPTEDVAEIRDGRKTVSTKKMYPGYILVEMDMEDDSWYLVKNTPGVTGFVGTGRNPTPITEEEVDRIMHQMTETTESPRPKVTYDINERVRVIEGPFSNFSGTVADINHERGKLKVMIDILGRQTSVELDFLHVEKI